MQHHSDPTLQEIHTSLERLDSERQVDKQEIIERLNAVNQARKNDTREIRTTVNRLSEGHRELRQIVVGTDGNNGVRGLQQKAEAETRAQFEQLFLRVRELTEQITKQSAEMSQHISDMRAESSREDQSMQKYVMDALEKHKNYFAKGRMDDERHRQQREDRMQELVEGVRKANTGVEAVTKQQAWLKLAAIAEGLVLVAVAVVQVI